MENDAIKNPSHYTSGRQFEPRLVIEDWGLDFYLGNALKYISRCGRKGDPIEDLEKAKQYLDFEIEKLSKEDRKDKGELVTEWRGKPMIDYLKTAEERSKKDKEEWKTECQMHPCCLDELDRDIEALKKQHVVPSFRFTSFAPFTPGVSCETQCGGDKPK